MSGWGLVFRRLYRSNKQPYIIHGHNSTKHVGYLACTIIYRAFTVIDGYFSTIPSVVGRIYESRLGDGGAGYFMAWTC